MRFGRIRSLIAKQRQELISFAHIEEAQETAETAISSTSSVSVDTSDIEKDITKLKTDVNRIAASSSGDNDTFPVIAGVSAGTIHGGPQEWAHSGKAPHNSLDMRYFLDSNGNQQHIGAILSEDFHHNIGIQYIDRSQENGCIVRRTNFGTWNWDWQWKRPGRPFVMIMIKNNSKSDKKIRLNYGGSSYHSAEGWYGTIGAWSFYTDYDNDKLMTNRVHAWTSNTGANTFDVDITFKAGQTTGVIFAASNYPEGGWGNFRNMSGTIMVRQLNKIIDDGDLEFNKEMTELFLKDGKNKRNFKEIMKKLEGK